MSCVSSRLSVVKPSASMAASQAARALRESRRNLVVDAIRRVNGLTLSPPEGAFYAYIGCRGLIGRRTPRGTVLDDDAAVATYLLNEGRVASVPGGAYGLSPYVRISTATSEAVLIEAARRITDAVAQVK